MSQRNPMNDRYTTDERTGKTRKSAASAKPASKAASSVRLQSQGNDKPKGLFSRARSQASQDQAGKDKSSGTKKSQKGWVYDVPTEEYRWWRRVWWMLIVAAIALTALSLFLMNYEPLRNNTYLTFAPMVVGYGALIASLFVDIKKIRKIREAYNTGRRVTDRSKDATKTRKERKAIERQRAAQLEAYEQEQIEKRNAKRAERNAKITSLFKRGGSGDTEQDGAADDKDAASAKSSAQAK